MIEKLTNIKKYEDRKGKIIEFNKLNHQQLSSVRNMEKKLGYVQEVRKYKTGTYGAYFKNNQFRFISGDQNTTLDNDSQWKVVNSLKKDFDNNNLKNDNNELDIDKIRFKVTDTRWSKSPNYKNLNNIRIRNNYKVGGKKNTQVGLKSAVELLRKYYSDNS